MVRLLTGAAALSILAGTAVAGMTPAATFEWREVDNSSANPAGDFLNGPAWAAGSWRTFDLFVTGDFLLNGVNLGSAPGEENLGLFVGNNVFNTTGFVASDFESAAQGAFNISTWDTYVTLGSNNAGGANPGQLLGIGLNGMVPNAEGNLRGAWAFNPPNGGTAQQASQGVRVLRVTVDANSYDASTFGLGFLQLGLDSGVFEYEIVPTPGAFALMGLGGLVAARRRR